MTTIIFDEFIIETGTIHYLEGRGQSTPSISTHGGQVSGPDTGTHAVQRHLHHEPVLHQMAHQHPTPGRVHHHGDGFVAAQFVDSQRFASQVATTRFGKFVTDFDEEYADYSIDNTFADNTGQFVQRKTGTAKYMFTVKTDLGTLPVWDGLEGYLFLPAEEPRVEKVYNTNKMTLREGEVLVSYCDKIAEMLRRLLPERLRVFDSPQSHRNAFAEIFVR